MGSPDNSTEKEWSVFDSGEFDFSSWGSSADPTRKFIAEELGSRIGRLEGLSLVDVGCGLGSFFPLWQRLGAVKVQGIEPSQNHYKKVAKLFPAIPIFKGTLSQFRTEEKFDIAVAIMIFEHLENAETALLQIKQLLRPGGKLFLVSTSPEYTQTPNFYYPIGIDKREDGSIAVTIHTPHGIIRDILRRTAVFLEAMKKVGFSKIEHEDLPPTDELITKAPRYAPYRNMPIRQLFILTV